MARVPLSQTILAVALIASAAVASPDAPAGEDGEVPEKPAVARLVTDADAIAPGEPFLVGVEVTPHPGWHIYWKNPGDAGLSTDLGLEVPEGFEVGEVRYPVPERFMQPGDIVGYGYSRPVVIFAEITAPATIAPGETVAIGVTADWLACKHVCILGRAAFETTRPVAETAVRSLRREAWAAALPVGMEGYRPFIDRVGATKTGPTAASYELTLDWLAVAPAGVEWIPDTPEAIRIAGVTTRRLGQKTEISFEASLRADASLEEETMETVVAYDGPGGERQGVLLPVSLKLLATPPN